MLSSVMGGTSDLEFQPARKVNPVQRRLADVEKARRLIGFEATMPLDEGLERLVAWWKAQ
jgi:UDP-glucose 4-epimerase